MSPSLMGYILILKLLNFLEIIVDNVGRKIMIDVEFEAKFQTFHIMQPKRNKNKINSK